MSYAITHRAFFGDAERDFALTSTVLLELEREADCGLGALFTRVCNQNFRAADVGAIVRLGLIGAGTAPREAARLVKVYVEDRPFLETLPLAIGILEARLDGRADSSPIPVVGPSAPAASTDDALAGGIGTEFHPSIGSE